MTAMFTFIATPMTRVVYQGKKKWMQALGRRYRPFYFKLTPTKRTRHHFHTIYHISYFFPRLEGRFKFCVSVAEEYFF